LGNRLFYLAVAPRFFSPIVKMLGQCCLSKEEEHRWSRVIVEKPFGHDLASAKQLNQELKQVLTEKQIYRIDHYLGKETVQNVMVFRFSNNIIEQLWSPEEVLTNMVRGQYGSGTIDGQRVVGYRSEPDVAADSNTETFVAMKLLIDNWRWAGVPFYLRTGKRLARRMTEIVIQFRR